MQTLSIYTHDLEYALLVKTLAIFNVLSQGNYYINVVLFNLVIFWGHYWLFLFFTFLFPDSRKNLFIIIFFFLPAVFWLSGIRSDGLLFFFFALFILSLQRGKVVKATVGLAGTFIMRPEFALLLALATLAWRLKSYVITYSVAAILFFSTGLDGFVARKQHQFMALRGSRLHLDALEPTVASYISVFPQALLNSFFGMSFKNSFQIFAALETLLVWLIIAAALIRQPRLPSDNMLRMLLCFSVSVYLFVGYIVPFPGAIVRYRIIPELILVTTAIGIIKKSNITVLSKPGRKI